MTIGGVHLCLQVDLFVGLLVEQPPPGKVALLGDTLTTLLACLFLTAFLNHDVIKIATLWTPEYLTHAGKAYIQAFSLREQISVSGCCLGHHV